MKIALFGATGGTGIEFLLQSINYPYDITAFARNPDVLRENFPNLKVVQASIDDVELLKNELQGFDAIVSLVGISGLLKARNPNAIYERTGLNLVRVAKFNSIKRLVVVSSGGVVEAANEPWFFKYLLKPIFLNKMYDDMLVMESIVTSSEIDYTIVRPPYLTKGKLTKKYRVILDKWFEDDKDLSRADLAHYLLNCVFDKGVSRKIVGISY